MRVSIVHRYVTAARYALLEQARNRLAFLLLLTFVPIWYEILGLLAPDTPLDFKFRVTGVFLHVSGHYLSFLTAGLNAITLIVGFMLFSSTRKNTPFDHRLVQSRYPQPLLILAKLTSLVAVAAVISLYASGVLYAFWRPGSLPLVWLGVLLRGELEGFFLIIMISLIDTFLQNPIGNPAANLDIVSWFPAYAPTQIVV